MTPTKENPFPDELAVYQEARRLRAEALAALFAKAGRGIKGLFGRHLAEPLRARARRQRQLEELMNMDDHMLRDLGLSRGGIAYAFEHGRETEPANANTPLTKPRAA